MTDDATETLHGSAATAEDESSVATRNELTASRTNIVITAEEKELQEAAEAEAAFMKKCKEIYQLFDRGTGHLLTKDLGLALRALGQIPSDHEIDVIVSKLEQEDLYARGHTKLTFDDFYRVLQEHSERKSDIREMVLDSFRSMDPENTGLVNASKIAAMLTSIGEALSAAEMREMLQDAEVDKDGNINYIKFVEDVLDFEVTSSGPDSAGKYGSTASATTSQN